MAYIVFHRSWWTPNADWPDGREPCPGHKTVIARNIATESQARTICASWNAKHPEGLMADRAEFEAQKPWGRKTRNPL